MKIEDWSKPIWDQNTLDHAVSFFWNIRTKRVEMRLTCIPLCNTKGNQVYNIPEKEKS